jgi:hypothetical protein
MASGAIFAWSFGVQSKSVNAGGKFRRQNAVYIAMAVDPTFSDKGGGHQPDAEMAFAAAIGMAGVTGVLVRFVDYLQKAGRERRRQFLLDASTDRIIFLMRHDDLLVDFNGSLGLGKVKIF